MKNIQVTEELLEEVKKEAEKKLEGVITPKQIGYEGFLYDEMRKILKAQNIEWKRPSVCKSDD